MSFFKSIKTIISSKSESNEDIQDFETIEDAPSKELVENPNNRGEILIGDVKTSDQVEDSQCEEISGDQTELVADEQEAVGSEKSLEFPGVDGTQEVGEDSEAEEASQTSVSDTQEEDEVSMDEKLIELVSEVRQKDFERVIHNLETDGFEKSLIWNNELFKVIREDILQNPDPCVIVPSESSQAIDCIGKSQLALELAWEMVREKKMRAVLHVPARDADMLTMRLALLVKKQVLDLPEQKDVQESNRFDGTLRWLQSEKNWLLVFTGVDTFEAHQSILDLLPKLSNGKVVIAGRITDWPELVKTYALSSLATEEGAHALLQVTEKSRKAMDSDVDSSKQLVRILGGNPTALQLVASYVNATESSLSHFLYGCQFKESDEFMTEIPEDDLLKTNHGCALRMNLKTLHPEATTLMKVLAYFADTPISASMLEQEVHVLNQAHELACKLHNRRYYAFNLKRALNELSRFGLISRSRDCVTIPRFILSFLQPRLSQTLTMQREASDATIPLKNYALRAALKLLHNASRKDPRMFEYHDYWHLLNPHVERVIDFCDQAGQISKTLYLMSQWALFLKSEGHIEKAEELYRRIIGICKEDHAVTQVQDAVGMNNLAQILAATKRFDESEALMVEVLENFRQRFGTDDPMLAKPLTNLAKIYQMAHRSEEAERLLRQALAIAHRQFDEPDEVVEMLQFQLADMLKKMNRHEEAEAMMRKAICTLVGRRFENCPEVATYLHHLGVIQLLRGQVVEAEKTLKRSVTIAERSFGKNNLKVAECLNGLVRMYLIDGRWREGKAVNERILRIYESTYGLDHPNLVKPLKVMVGIYKTQRDWKRSEQLQERVLKLEEQCHGLLSLPVAAAMRELSKLYLLNGKVDESDTISQKAKTISGYMKPRGPSESGPQLPEFSELGQSA